MGPQGPCIYRDEFKSWLGYNWDQKLTFKWVPPPFLQATIDTKVRVSDDADDLIDAEKLGLENHVLHALHIEYHPQ